MQSPKPAPEVQTVPTLIESIYGNAKLLFDKTVKEFDSEKEAEEWATSNGIQIKIRHKAGCIVGDNNIRNNFRDDSEKLRLERYDRIQKGNYSFPKSFGG